jgi:chromosome partitioning protein
MRRIAVACLKGGSSKSTTSTSVAVGLARRGLRVLVIDSDASCNATWLLTGGQGADGPTLAEVLTRQASAAEAIRPSTVPGLELLPASSTLGAVNVQLAQELSRDTRLRSGLASIEGSYDFAIADTGPTFTTLLANVLVWATEVIVPADPGVFAMLGLVELQGVIEEVRDAYGNEGLHLAGLVLTRMARNNVHKDVEKSLRESYGDKVFAATIPLATAVEQAHTRAMTVMQHAPKSPAALAYDDLVREIIEHGRDAKDGGRKSPGRGPGTSAPTPGRIAG